jgi:hypothetical protein
MKLENLALISEVVASAAIVITLIVLIIQVDGNTEAVRAATYQDVADSLTSIPVTIAADRDLARIFNAGMSGSLDDPLDSQQFSLLALMQVRRFENAFHQRDRMDAGLWLGVRNSLGMFAAGRGFGAWWDENRGRFSPDFQELIGELRNEPVD